MICPYCNGTAEWVENKEIYGKNYGRSFMIYLCRSCHAYVGCHENSRKPLGTLANAETRDWRKKAHTIFDPLWKTNIQWSDNRTKVRREKAYGLLKRYFGFDVHIGEADVKTCKKIIELIEVKR